MAATINDVREFIRTADSATLKVLGDVISSRWKHLQAELSFNFMSGDRVYFIKGKRDPRKLTGTVKSSDGKWVYLAVDGHPVGPKGWNWKVAPSLLKKVA